MKILRAVPVLLALAASGCILTSGQFVVTYDLGTVNVTSPSAVVGVQVEVVLDVQVVAEIADMPPAEAA